MARRRGLATALQAALGAAAGGLGGYAQQREMERRREQEQMDRALSLFERGAFEAGPIATRAPSAPPRTLAAAGEEVKAPRPSMGAIPLAGVGSEAMQQAAAGLERYETGGPGAMTFELGGRRMVLPSMATRRAEAAQDALSSAMAQARAELDVRRGQQQLDEQSAFNALKRAGQVRGDFDPQYGQYGADLADYRAIRRSQATKPGASESRLDYAIRQAYQTVADMVQRGKPGLPGMASTPYAPDELQTAFDQIVSTGSGRQGQPMTPRPGTVRGPAINMAPAPRPFQGTAAPRMGMDTMATRDMSPLRPTLRDRAQQLRNEGKTEEQALVILRQEGYPIS